MLSKIITASINGMDVEKVTVETDFSQGLPFLSLVGLPDTTVRESKERIRSAIINSGYVFPLKRITINLSPADTRKTGSHFDLPMAVGILGSMGLFSPNMCKDTAFLGELSLDGTINGVQSCLALLLGLKEHGIKRIFVPLDNTEDLMCVDGMEIYGVSTFTRLMDHMTEIEPLSPLRLAKIEDNILTSRKSGLLDYADVHGQGYGKRAMQISAAGWHDIIMTGPPGAGKTMLASRLCTLMPDPTKEELMEITKIHSIAGEPMGGNYMTGSRPFRSPHHTATPVSLMGGGYNSKPGELSLAHRGILFLDELPEFEKRILDMLRQPLEDGFINITRLSESNRYPCRFILVAAMNPCPCGYYGDYTHECICNTAQRMRYMRKISGPFMDRMDLYVKINPVDYKEVIKNKFTDVSSSSLREDVLVATDIQNKRYAGMKHNTNSQIPDSMLDDFCKMTISAKKLFETVCLKDETSARRIGKIKRISRTIADLADSDIIDELHIAEALSYQPPQKNDLLN